MVFVFLRLTCFTQHDSLSVHPCWCEWHASMPSFLQLGIFHVYLGRIFFIRPAGGHLDGLPVLAIVTADAVNTGPHVSFQIRAFSRYMPKTGIAEPHGGSGFSFLRNLRVLPLSGCTSLHSHQQWRRAPFVPHPLQCLLFVTDWFQIGKGGRQGCILSPCLYNLYAEYITRNTGLDEAQGGIKIAGEISQLQICR